MCNKQVVEIIMEDGFRCKAKTTRGVCNNDAMDYGFYSCDEDGVIIEPTKGIWKGHWVCEKCQQIYLDTKAYSSYLAGGSGKGGKKRSVFGFLKK
ncbi:hypothetical protein [Bacillus cereus]|uniref:hypothetical protein n=1 Tax=Bacillus cereus TaxID=1396 RepID=UPI001C8BA984|nr:hypothetical protein [Bacillus cereus]MBX9158640.1 hypothetical protein [Bacillus cereus]